MNTPAKLAMVYKESLTTHQHQKTNVQASVFDGHGAVNIQFQKLEGNRPAHLRKGLSSAQFTLPQAKRLREILDAAIRAAEAAHDGLPPNAGSAAREAAGGASRDRANQA